MTVLQKLVTEKQPPLTSTHSINYEMTNTLTHLMWLYYIESRPNHNLVYTVDHTFGYHSQKLICACVKSSVHAHGTEIRGGNSEQFKTSVGLAR